MPDPAPQPLTTTVTHVPDAAGEETGPYAGPVPRGADVPTTVGEHEVLGVLGRGGMGVVYKARHRRLGRLVALKMILAGGHAGPDALARFRSEAEALARLQHPAIVQVHEIGEHEGLPYFSLELVGGGSLARRLAGAPQPADEAARVCESLARAVDAAHRAGVVHRDLKPANVLLTEDGTPKITDFGLAKRLEGDSLQTQSGAILGTPSYMAPEQASGKVHEVGPAADVYALGAILYEMLTGRPPFKGASVPDTLDQVCTREPVPPSRLQPRVPRDLEVICLKCLQKEPGRRYPSAAALAEDLRRFRAGEPIIARPVLAWERLVKWVRRRPAAAGLLAASFVGLLALVGFGVSLAYNRELDRARQNAEFQHQRAEDALEESRTFRYFISIGLAERYWSSNNVGRTRELLAECQPERRGWEYHYLDRLAHVERQTLAGHRGEIYNVAFSPDGELLASASMDRTIILWQAATGRRLHTLSGHDSHVYAVAFRPDGKKLASAGGGGTHPGDVLLWDVDTLRSGGPEAPGARRVLLRGRAGERCKLAFSPDGKRLALAAGLVNDLALRQLVVLDTATGKECFVWKTRLGGFLGVAFSPDGRRLAATSGSSNLSGTKAPAAVQLWDTHTGKELVVFKTDTAALHGVAFSPNGKSLAASGQDGRVRLWAVDGPPEPRLLDGHTGAATALAFTPDGLLLATASEDATVRLWDVAAGKQAAILRGHTADGYCVAWDSGGRRLASSGNDAIVRIWDRDTLQEARTLRGHTASAAGVAFSPAGRWLASAGHDRTVRLWNLNWPGVSRVLGRHAEVVWCVAFSPDGRSLASGGGDWQKTRQLGEFTVWDVATGKMRFTRRAHVGLVWTVAFSPDGKQLATGGGEFFSPGEVKVWDAHTGAELRTLPGPKGVQQLAFSPDGRRLAAVAPQANVLAVWDPATGANLLSVPERDYRIMSVAFSPDGKLLATGGSDQVVKLRDAATGAVLRTLRGHTSDVNGLAFSPDGRRLVSASYDQSLKVWDVPTGQEVLTLKGHSDSVLGVACSPDGRTFASCSDDQTIKLWDGTPRQPAPAEK